MGRSVVDAVISTRNARSKLPSGKAVHWRAIDRGLHLGYRKGRDGGSWVGRRRLAGGRYETWGLGAADDVLEADGRSVFSYSEALAKAKTWHERRVEADQRKDTATAQPLTVREAMAEYLAYLQAERKTAQDARYRIEAHILPALGSIEVSALTTPQIHSWHRALGSAPARVRASAMQRARGEARFRQVSDEPVDRRRRQAAANRVLTILKAGLNRAFEHQGDRVPSDDAWRRVKPFKNVDAARIDYLTGDECRRLVNAAAPDFRQLVRAALYTGCRYAELGEMRCRDFNHDTRTVFVRPGKSGRGRHAVLTDEAARFFRAATAGRSPEDRIFVRSNGAPWARSLQKRRLAEAAAAARIGRPLTFHALRHTHASHLAMQGTPMAVIAEQLGHADIRMVVKHYAHLSPSYVADTIRANLPSFGLSSDEVVVPLTGSAGGS